MDAPEDIQRTVQSFLIIQPRGVSTVCHWAGGRQSTLCGTFAASLLSGVFSSRVLAAHLTCSTCTTIQKGVSSAGAMRKSWFWWRTYVCPVCLFVTRCKGTPSVTWHTTLYSSSSHWSFAFPFPL